MKFSEDYKGKTKYGKRIFDIRLNANCARLAKKGDGLLREKGRKGRDMNKLFLRL